MKKKSFSFWITVLTASLMRVRCESYQYSKIKIKTSGTRVMSCTFSSRVFIVISREAKKILINSSKNPARMLLLILHLLLTETIRILSIFVFLLLMIIRRKFVIFLIFPQRSLMNMEIPHLFPVLFTKKISHLKI